MSKNDYFVFDEIAQKPEVKALFDKALAQIDSGELPRVNRHYPIGLMVDKQKLLGSSVLEYRLSQETLADFHYEDVRAFTEKLRVLMGWHEVDYELRHWVEKALRDPYFKDEGNDFIYAVDGDFQISAGKGKDCVVVGDGRNRISDGSGTDVVIAR